MTPQAGEMLATAQAMRSKPYGLPRGACTHYVWGSELSADEVKLWTEPRTSFPRSRRARTSAAERAPRPPVTRAVELLRHIYESGTDGERRIRATEIRLWWPELLEGSSDDAAPARNPQSVGPELIEHINLVGAVRRPLDLSSWFAEDN